jgi:hypothetical protein
MGTSVRPGVVVLPLGVLAVVVVVAAVGGVIPIWPGLVQTVALPPLGLTTDLRILLVDATSYPSFVAGVVLSVVARTTVLAAMLGLSRATLAFSARLHGLMLPLAALAAMGLFAAPATLFYLLFWIGVVVAVLIELAATAMAFSGETTLRSAAARSLRSGLRLGTVGAYLVALVVLGAVGDLLGSVAQVALVPVSAGLAGLVAWMLLTDPRRRWMVLTRRAVAGIGALGVAVLMIVVVTGPPAPEAPDGEIASRSGSLLLMSGVDSSSGSGAVLEIDPASLGFDCDQAYYFSYAGPGDGQPQRHAQCPIRTGAPYEAAHTYGTTPGLVEHFVTQVSALPDPVTVLTHSQGAWVVWEALASRGAMGVGDLVLIGPFPDNPVGYPVDRAAVPGRVGTDVIDIVIGTLARRGGISEFTYDAPLATELLAAPDQTDAIWARPLPPGVRGLTVPSAFDLPFQVRTRVVSGVTNTCPLPVAHPNLPYAVGFIEATNRHLDGEEPRGCVGWSALGPLFSGFSTPPSPGLRQFFTLQGTSG